MPTTNVMVGQLLVCGFEPTTLPASLERALAEGRRGGAILFKRNGDHAGMHALNVTIRDAARRCAAIAEETLVCVDQEGGRVERLKAPVLTLPPALTLASLDDAALIDVARAQSEELLALGFTMNFAPVLDVHSREENPIIGDRAFGVSPQTAAQKALLFAKGMREAGLLSCGKHFPGHGDTTVDSHLALPTVSRSRAELNAQELLPFRAACPYGVDAFMTAHVVYTALDEDRPATLSPTIATNLLRGELGYEGVLFSDDLEMRALSTTVGESSVLSILAGCDAVLVCCHEELAEEAYEAMVREAERSPAFRARVEDAWKRVKRMRQRIPKNRTLHHVSELEALKDRHASARALVTSLANGTSSVS